MSFWIIFVVCLWVGEVSVPYVGLGPQEVTGNCRLLRDHQGPFQMQKQPFHPWVLGSTTKFKRCQNEKNNIPNKSWQICLHYFIWQVFLNMRRLWFSEGNLGDFMLVIKQLWCPYVSLNNGTNIVLTIDMVTPFISTLGVKDFWASTTLCSQELFYHLHFPLLCRAEGSFLWSINNIKVKLSQSIR